MKSPGIDDRVSDCLTLAHVEPRFARGFNSARTRRLSMRQGFTPQPQPLFDRSVAEPASFEPMCSEPVGPRFSSRKLTPNHLPPAL